MEGTAVGMRRGKIVHVGCCVSAEYLGDGLLCGGSAERSNARERSSTEQEVAVESRKEEIILIK